MQNGIECPPDNGDQTKCLVSGNRCKKVNTWVEWLVMNGGKGLSRQQLREGYQNRSARYTYNYFCRHAKARGKSNELELAKIGNPVIYYTSQPQIRPLSLFWSRRNKIIKILKNDYHFEDDVSWSTFTASDLEHVIETIDDFYFNGTLLPDMRTRSDIQFFTARRPSSRTGMWVSHPGTMNHFYINLARWERAAPVRVDGIKVNTPLEALVVMAEHELCHAIINVYHPQGPGNSGHHGVVFRQLLNRLFGHSESKYTYRTDDSDVIVV